MIHLFQQVNNLINKNINKNNKKMFVFFNLTLMMIKDLH